MSFTEVHTELAPEGDSEEGEGATVKVEVARELKEEEEDEKEVEEGGAEEALAIERNLSLVSEGVSEEYALSSTVQHGDPREAGEEEVKVEEDMKEFVQQ